MRTRTSNSSVKIVGWGSTSRLKKLAHNETRTVKGMRTLDTNSAWYKQVMLALGSLQYTDQAHRWHVGSAHLHTGWYMALSCVGEVKKGSHRAMYGIAACKVFGSQCCLCSPLKLHWGYKLWDKVLSTEKRSPFGMARNAMSETALRCARCTQLCMLYMLESMCESFVWQRAVDQIEKGLKDCRQPRMLISTEGT